MHRASLISASLPSGRSFDSGGVKSIEVLSGLNDGDKVVTVGGALLRPDERRISVQPLIRLFIRYRAIVLIVFCRACLPRAHSR